MITKPKSLIVSLFLLLSACNFSLAQDIKPPADLTSNAEELTSTTPQLPISFEAPPNLVNGKNIYLSKCAPCHGINGLSDGELSDELIEKPPAIGSAVVSRSVSLQDWYQVVTQGRMEKQMPSFSSLTEQDRWDVVAYGLSLSISAEQLVQGKALYSTNCSNCHGENGQGSGPQAGVLEKQPVSFTDQTWVISKSANDLFETVKGGMGGVMPAFSSLMTDSQIWSVVDYVRLMPFSELDEIFTEKRTVNEVEATSTPGVGLSLTSPLTDTTTGTPQFTKGSITGKITNLTNGIVPEGLEVYLHGFDQMQTVITESVKIRDDGTFIIEEIPFVEGRTFLTTVNYEGITYGSELGTIEQGTETLALPIEIYESTSDPSTLSIERLHIFLEPLSEDTIRVVELLVISNSGNEVVRASNVNEPVFSISLPEGFVNLEFQDGILGERFIPMPEGFADLMAVKPGIGVNQILLSYELPMNRNLDFTHPVGLRTEAVVIMVPENSLRIKGKLQDIGIRQAEGFKFRTYQAPGLNVGESLRLTISKGSSIANLPELMIGLTSLVGVLFVISIWFYARSRKVDQTESSSLQFSTKKESPEVIMDAILALDDLYKDGQIPEEAYKKRRQELKNDLRILLDQEK